jgi:ribosomal protein S30
MPRNHTPRLPATERKVRAPRTLRIDEDLRQQLEAAADKSVRSVNSEIIFRLQSTFKPEASAN